MRIVCPTCSVAYDVPDSLVTVGRVVRCAGCGSDWTPVTAAAAPAEPLQSQETLVPEDIPTTRTVATARQSAMERLAAHAAWPQPSHQLRLAWAASIAVLLLAAAGAYAWRADIMTAWPPSARAYAALGLHAEVGTAR